MCPFCMTMAAVAVGTTSAGGLGMLALTRRRRRNGATETDRHLEPTEADSTDETPGLRPGTPEETP